MYKNKTIRNLYDKSHLVFPFTAYLFELVNISFKWYMGRLAMNGDISFGDFFTIDNSLIIVNAHIEQLVTLKETIIEGIEKVENFLKFYDAEVTIKSTKNYIPSNNEINGYITFDNVSFKYPHSNSTINLFDNLSFEIQRGQQIAFVGSSGSGKSTIMKLLLRLYDVSNGMIKIDNIDLKEYDIQWIRRQICSVEQEPNVFSGTIKENICYGTEEFDEGLFKEVCRLSLVNAFVDDESLFPEGIDTLVGERGVKISGGQKQRIAIARALMRKGKILVIDEATSALDAENEKVIQENIKRIIKERKMTVIIIAHRLSTIKDVDKIYVVKTGKIVEQGKHEELIELNGEYKKLVEKQMIK